MNTKKKYSKEDLLKWFRTIHSSIFQLKMIREETQLDKEFEPIILSLIKLATTFSHLYGEITIREKNPIKKEKE